MKSSIRISNKGNTIRATGMAASALFATLTAPAKPEPPKEVGAVEKILTGKIFNDGDSGDGKRMFLVADSNDGWQDLRIEIDTDDCDSDYAKAWAERIIQCVNACAGIKNPVATERPAA